MVYRTRPIRLWTALLLVLLAFGAVNLPAAAQQGPATSTGAEALNAPRMIDAFRVDRPPVVQHGSMPRSLAIMMIFGTTLVVGAFILEFRRRRIHDRRRRRY